MNIDLVVQNMIFLLISECLYKNKVYRDGEEFSLDPCTSCSCVNGSVKCGSVQCDPADCGNPVTLPGQCCSSCGLGSDVMILVRCVTEVANIDKLKFLCILTLLVCVASYISLHEQCNVCLGCAEVHAWKEITKAILASKWI